MQQSPNGVKLNEYYSGLIDMQSCTNCEMLDLIRVNLSNLERVRSTGELASGIAHDLNNYLGVMLGNVQLLLRSVSSARERARLLLMEKATFDAASTLHRIHEAVKSPLCNVCPVDISTEVMTVVDMVLPVWRHSMHVEHADMDAEFRLEQGLYTKGSASELRSVFTNVLLNAMQSMPNGGKLHISSGRDGDSVWVAVTDSGTGMTDDVLEHVFDAFYTTKGSDGTGLGMSVSLNIIKEHQGHIAVDSKPDIGTTVKIILPSCNAPDSMDEKSVYSKDLFSAVRVLIVDDGEFSRILVDSTSERVQEAYLARDCMEALEVFGRRPFDIVVADVSMPVVCGWELSRTIKAMNPHTLMVLLADPGIPDEPVGQSELQPDLVFTKPISVEYLRSAIGHMLYIANNG